MRRLRGDILALPVAGLHAWQTGFVQGGVWTWSARTLPFAARGVQALVSVSVQGVLSVTLMCA